MSNGTFLKSVLRGEYIKRNARLEPATSVADVPPVLTILAR